MESEWGQVTDLPESRPVPFWCSVGKLQKEHEVWCKLTSLDWDRFRAKKKQSDGEVRTKSAKAAAEGFDIYEDRGYPAGFMSGRVRHSDTKSDRRRLWLLCLSVAPSLGPLLLIRLLGTKAIFCDEWGLPYFFQKLREGDLLLSVLWKANNEHRLVFPRLLFGLVAVTTNWDPRVVMYFSVVFMAFSWAIFTWTFVNRFGYHRRRLVLVLSLSSLIFFSVAQQQNWLWAFQTAFFIIVGCQFLAVATLLNQRLHCVTRTFLAALLCIIASFSSAQGLFSWIAILPLVAATPNMTKTRCLLVAVWSFIAATVWSIYWMGLDLSHTGGVKILVAHPLKVLRFSLVLTGAPFVGPGADGFRIVTACLIGTIIVFVSIAAPLIIVRKAGWKVAALPFSLTLIGLVPLAALSLGRLQDYGDALVVPRYTTPLIALPLSALIALFILQGDTLAGDTTDHLGGGGPRLAKHSLSKVLFLPLCGLLLGGYLWNLPDSISQAAQDSSRNEIATQLNQFSECLHPSIDGDDPEVDAFGVNIDGLNDRGGMRILAAGGYRPLIQRPEFVEKSTQVAGQIEASETAKEGNGRARTILSGDCTIFSPGRFAPFVFVTNGNNPRIIGAAHISALSSRSATATISWKVPVSTDLCTRAPDQSVTLDTWLYDEGAKEFCLIAGTTFKPINN